MWLSTLFSFRKERSTSRRPGQRRVRLMVQPLEDRSVPASFTAASVAELIANIHAANETPEADTITLLPAARFTLTEVNHTTHGATGLPVIAAGENLTIAGNGAVIERSTARGTPAFRLFDVAAGAALTLENLTLQGGLAFGYGVSAEGGAVYNQGTLTLDGVTVQNNIARGADGGVVWGVALGGSTAAGGGIYSTGSLTMLASTIRNNSAIGGRGGAGGTDGGDGFGGGLCAVGGTVTLRTTSVTDNVARGGAGGGRGIGGGLFISPGTWVGLDAFTESHIRLNKASTSHNNVAGDYVVIS